MIAIPISPGRTSAKKGAVPGTTPKTLGPPSKAPSLDGERDRDRRRERGREREKKIEDTKIIQALTVPVLERRSNGQSSEYGQ